MREKLTLEPTATDKGLWANRIEFDPTGRLTGLIERQNGSWKTAYWPAGGSGYRAPEGTELSGELRVQPATLRASDDIVATYDPAIGVSGECIT